MIHVGDLVLAAAWRCDQREEKKLPAFCWTIDISAQVMVPLGTLGVVLRRDGGRYLALLGDRGALWITDANARGVMRYDR